MSLRAHCHLPCALCADLLGAQTDERRSCSIDGEADAGLLRGDHGAPSGLLLRTSCIHRVHHMQGEADDVTELLIAALTAAAGLCKRRAPTTTTSRVAAGLVRRSAVTGSHAALRMRLVVGLSLGLELLLLYQSDCACRSEPIAANAAGCWPLTRP